MYVITAHMYSVCTLLFRLLAKSITLICVYSFLTVENSFYLLLNYL